MQLIDALEAALREVDSSVGKALEPIRVGARLLTTMPGVSDIVANVIVAEIGILRDGTEYRDLGPEYFAQRDQSKTISRLLRRLNNLGLQVEVKPTAA
jgi:hypothetical protein